MRPLTLRPFLALLVVAALSPGRACGEMVNFAYTWSFGETYLSAFGPGPINLSSSLSSDGSTFTVDYGSGTAALTLASPGSAGATPGDAPVTIPVGNLAAATADKPAGNFSYSAGLNLTLRVTDLASGDYGDLTLAASLFGNVSPKGADAGAAGWTTWGAQALLLDGRYYTAGFAPEETDPLVLGAEPVPFRVGVYIDPPDLFPVEVTLGSNPNQQTPEPSTLALGACALALCGLRGFRRRRKD